MFALRHSLKLLGGAGLGALALGSAALPAAPVSATFTDSEYLAATAGFGVTLDAAEFPAGAQPAFVLGATDLTSLFVAGAPGEYRYPPESLPLPAGEHELVVYAVVGEDWQEVARLPLKVLTPGGFEKAELIPKVDLALKAQLASNTKGDAPALDRETFQDLELSGGLTGEHRRGAFGVRSSANISGFSNRPDALRYGELADDTPKLDLNDYLIEAELGAANLNLGHVSFGNHPLLVSNIAHRGLTAKYPLGDRFDVGLGLLSGRAIVGYNNLFGLDQWGENRIAAATFGVELLPARPGGLRAEVSYLSGVIPSQNDFNTGEVTDVEDNRGFGLRLSGSDESGRLRGEINYARSRFDNPPDPSLALDDEEIVPVKTSTDTAYAIEVAYTLLQESTLFGEQPANLTLTARHAHADALYKSLGAYVDANLDSYILGADASIGQVTGQLAYRWTQDNVDDLPTLLTTRTRGLTFGLNFPLPGLFAESAYQGWLPNLSYALERVHQQATNIPDPELSGFDDPSQLPDQVTRLDALDFGWTGERWDFGYRLSYAREDNRQTGRERADFNTLEHRAQLGFRPSETVNLMFGLGRNRQQDREQGLVNYSTDYSLGLDWQFLPEWSFGGSLTLTHADDDADITRNRVSSAQTQLSYRFDVPGPGGRRLPGQWFVRYGYDQQSDRNRAFDLDSTATTWTFLSGLSFSFQ